MKTKNKSINGHSTYTYNHSMQKTKVEGLGVRGQPGLHREYVVNKAYTRRLCLKIKARYGRMYL